MTPVRYVEVTRVPDRSWLIQGTVFPTANEAKYAAVKLYTSLLNNGVCVKKIGTGWTCFFWRV